MTVCDTSRCQGSHRGSPPSVRHLEGAERKVQDKHDARPDQDPNIARARARNGAGVPRLAHRRDDDRKRQRERGRRGEAPRELARAVPRRHVVPRPGVAPEDEVLGEHDDGPDGAPVADDAEHVDEGFVEGYGADDSDGDEAVEYGQRRQ